MKHNYTPQSEWGGGGLTGFHRLKVEIHLH